MRKRIKKKFLGFVQLITSKKVYLSLFLFALILPTALAFIILKEKRGATGTEFSVEVVPLARSAYFQFRLDLLPGPLPSTLYDPVHMPMLQVPETHKAKISWRESGTTGWREGQDFVHVQKTVLDLDSTDGTNPPTGNNDPRMTTMLFGLEEGKDYEYRVSFQGQGYPTIPIEGSFKTLTSEIPTKDTADVTIYNTNTNVRETVKNALAGGASGKLIEFASTNPSEPAVFRDQIVDTGGASRWVASHDNWLTVQGKEGHKIIFDGSDPFYDVVNQDMWVSCNSSNNYCGKPDLGITDSSGIYRTKVQYYEPNRSSWINFNMNDPNQLRNAPSKVYYEREAFGDSWVLQNVSSGSGCDSTACPWKGVESILYRGTKYPNDGIYSLESGYIYVRLHKGLNPNSVKMKIPVLLSPMQLYDGSGATELKNIVVNNLTFQYYATPDYVTFHIGRVSDLVIKNITFKGSISSPIGAAVHGDQYRKNIIIKGCKLSLRGMSPEFDSGTGDWISTKWGFLKASKEETVAMAFKATGVSIIDSAIDGYNNGIGVFGTRPSSDNFNTVPPKTSYPVAWEIDNNILKGMSDDAIEVESWAMGLSITRNKFESNFKGISMAPVRGGPIYIVRNISVGRGEFIPGIGVQAPLKIGNNPGNMGFDSALKFIANNSFINVNKNPRNVYINNNGEEVPTALPGFKQEGSTSNLQAFNNYVVTDNGSIALNDGNVCYPQIFDHNLYMVVKDHLGLLNNLYYRQFASVTPCGSYGYGDKTSGINYRHVMKFEDWQGGKERSGVISNYFPLSPLNPASTSDPNYDEKYHSKVYPWIHDPNGKHLAYDNINLAPSDYNLINPVDTLTGNFTPKAGSPNVAMGMDLANITYDVGPGWVEYEEPRGMVTAGAIPAEDGTDPIVTLDSSASTYENMDLTIKPSVLNTSTFLWSKVNESDPIEFVSSNSIKDVVIRSSSITGKDNSYRLKLTATSSAGVISDDNFIDIHVHKLADINGDNSINFTDFSFLLSSWGTSTNSLANIVRTGTSATNVDFQDFSVLLSKWGS